MAIQQKGHFTEQELENSRENELAWVNIYIACFDNYGNYGYNVLN
ncbi:hypothetical protein [Solibacillus cecembensis]